MRRSPRTECHPVRRSGETRSRCRQRQSPRRAMRAGFEIAPSSLASQLVIEVVLERKLDPVVVGTEAVAVVVAATPLKLAAHHHVWNRQVQEVAYRVLTGLEVERQLPAARVDVETRVPGAARPVVVPRTVVEGQHPDKGKRFADYRRAAVAGVHSGTDVDRRVVHVVLDALAEYDSQVNGVTAKLQVRRCIDAPAPGMSTEVERVLQ